MSVKTRKVLQITSHSSSSKFKSDSNYCYRTKTLLWNEMRMQLDEERQSMFMKEWRSAWQSSGEEAHVSRAVRD